MLNRIYHSIIVICIGIIGFGSFNLSMDYINFSHGLHPIIGFPVTFICIFILYFYRDLLKLYAAFNKMLEQMHDM